jgi:hypothetical protein
MPNFMIAYHGGSQPASEEEGRARMERWKNWIEGLGDTVVNPGIPLPVSMILTSTGVEEDTDVNAMMGFAVLKAGSMEEAVAIAGTDPFLETGGKIRVSQMME